MSAFISHLSFVITSGARKAGVPKSAGPFVIFIKRRAAPKSANFILPSFDTRIFCPFISRWTIPCL